VLRFEDMKDVSIVIPVYNSQTSLEMCLEALQAQTYPADCYEIIVVDNGSDKSVEAALMGRFPNVRCLVEKTVGSYAARTLGVQHASGRIVAFTDADCIPDRNWVAKAIEAMKELEATIVGGHIRLINPTNRSLNLYEIYEQNAFDIANSKRIIEKKYYATTANLIAYRAVFKRVGYFDCTLRSNGDKDWVQRALRAGELLRYSSDVVVSHPRRSTFVEIERKIKRIAGGNITLNRRNHAPWSEIVFELFKESPMHPNLYRFAFTCEGVVGLHNRVKFVFLTLLFALIQFKEKLRVLFGATSSRV